MAAMKQCVACNRQVSYSSELKYKEFELDVETLRSLNISGTARITISGNPAEHDLVFSGYIYVYSAISLRGQNVQEIFCLNRRVFL